MLKAGDLARREDRRVRGGQNREIQTRSGDITCMLDRLNSMSNYTTVGDKFSHKSCCNKNKAFDNTCLKLPMTGHVTIRGGDI